MPQALGDALNYSREWLEVIQKPSLTEAEGRHISEEARVNFAEYFNRGWLEYRKSVTEAGDWAATGWTGGRPAF